MPAWIIERPRRRRRRSPKEQTRPVLQLPLQAPRREPVIEEDEESKAPERGVAVVDFYL